MKSPIKCFGLLLLCCYVGHAFSKNPTSVLDTEKAKQEILALRYERPDSAIALINQYLTVSMDNGDSASMAFLYTRKGIIMSLANKKAAIQYYFKALNICKEIKDSSCLSLVYNCIGAIEGLSTEQQKELLFNALKINLSRKDTTSIIEVYVNLGIIYNSQGGVDSAFYYYEKSLQLSKKINYETGVVAAYNNIGEQYIQKEQYSTALKYIFLSQNHISKSNEVRPVLFLSIRFNLMRIYLKLGKLDSALYYFDLNKKNFNISPPVEVYSYRLLSKYYKQIHNYEKSLSYLSKADSVREVKMDDTRADENLYKMLELEYDSKIRKEQLIALNAKMKQARNTRIFLLIGLLLTILFSIILFYQQKQKSRKKRALFKAKQNLLNSELQTSEIKRKYLNDELKYTNKELTSFAINIVQNRSLWKDTHSRISSMLGEESITSIKDQLRELNMALLQVFQSNKQQTEFLQRSQQLNHSLAFYLKSNYSELTETDINLLLLIFLKFSSKEIATLFNIEPTSAKMRRNRVRKKLGLDPEERFETFFESILESLQQTQKKQSPFIVNNIVQHHSLWEDTRSRISHILKEKGSLCVKDQLWELDSDMLQAFQSNEERAKFLHRSRQLNHSLVSYLKSNFPKLTKADINLLILIFLKFSSKEIGTLFNIEPASAKMKRNRVRKKLDLSPEESFEIFFERVLEALQEV